ncbi:MAG: DoxX family protein [bacterium]|nr:DoxX family protein [bacterium]
MLNLLRPNLIVQASPLTVRLYWLATTLFILLFVASIGLTLFDLEGSYASYARLGFPMWAIFFNAIAKILGVIAILHNRSRTLKDFAFAGFLYDLLLAFCAHIALGESDVLLAILGIILWVFAFIMDRKAFPVQDSISVR